MARQDQESIVRYVDGEMTPEEKLRMETDLAADAGLSEAVRLYAEMKAALAERLPADAGREALLRTMGGMREKYFAAAGGAGEAGRAGEGATERVDEGTVRAIEAGAKSRVISMRRYLTGLAAAAAVIIAVVMVWPSGRGGWMDSYGATQMTTGVERGEANDSLMTGASALFNKGAFGEAVAALNKVLAADSANAEALLYRGIAQLHTGAVEAARKDLTIVAEGESLFVTEAAYYMGLSYAQEKNAAKARDWLLKVPAGGPFGDRAKEVLRKLE